LKWILLIIEETQHVSKKVSVYKGFKGLNYAAGFQYFWYFRNYFKKYIRKAGVYNGLKENKKSCKKLLTF